MARTEIRATNSFCRPLDAITELISSFKEPEVTSRMGATTRGPLRCRRSAPNAYQPMLRDTRISAEDPWLLLIDGQLRIKVCSVFETLEYGITHHHFVIAIVPGIPSNFDSIHAIVASCVRVNTKIKKCQDSFFITT